MSAPPMGILLVTADNPFRFLLAEEYDRECRTATYNPIPRRRQQPSAPPTVVKPLSKA